MAGSLAAPGSTVVWQGAVIARHLPAGKSAHCHFIITPLLAPCHQRRQQQQQKQQGTSLALAGRRCNWQIEAHFDNYYNNSLCSRQAVECRHPALPGRQCWRWRYHRQCSPFAVTTGCRAGSVIICGSLEVNSGKTEAPKPNSKSTNVTVDSHSDDSSSIIHVESPNKPGTFQIVTSSLTELGLRIVEALVDSAHSKGFVSLKFYVTDSAGQKIAEPKDARNIETVVLTALNNSSPAKPVKLPGIPSTSYTDGDLSDSELRSKLQLLYRLMDTYLQNDVFSLQKSIMDHVEYTIARSRFNFDDFEAYMVFLQLHS
jgi:hypothetical protein